MSNLNMVSKYEYILCQGEFLDDKIKICILTRN